MPLRTCLSTEACMRRKFCASTTDGGVFFLASNELMNKKRASLPSFFLGLSGQSREIDEPDHSNVGMRKEAPHHPYFFQSPSENCHLRTRLGASRRPRSFPLSQGPPRLCYKTPNSFMENQSAALNKEKSVASFNAVRRQGRKLVWRSNSFRIKVV